MTLKEQIMKLQTYKMRESEDTVYVERDDKKQEICEYCHEDRDGYVVPLEKNCHAFIRFGMDGWELSLHAKGWHGSTKIKYCPMCGRELKNG